MEEKKQPKLKRDATIILLDIVASLLLCILDVAKNIFRNCSISRGKNEGRVAGVIPKVGLSRNLIFQPDFMLISLKKFGITFPLFWAGFNTFSSEASQHSR